LRSQTAQQAGKLVGRNVAQLLRVPQAITLQSLLGRFTGSAHVANAVHCRVEMVGPASPLQGSAWNALLKQMPVDGRMDIYWFLSPALAGEVSLLNAQSAFVRAVDSDHGVMVADPFGTMSSASAGFCRMSGYAEAELVGNNPRLLSSGRHDIAFCQNFWLELLDVGRWSGTIFNRRKGGQIYLQWQTVTMVESIDGTYWWPTAPGA
jgi:PAS domain S-box-containing protein